MCQIPLNFHVLEVEPLFYYFAPLEGITNDVYRKAHRRHFPSMDNYFTPFLIPNSKQGISSKDRKDLLPERNEGISLVPQLLTNRSEDFVLAAKALQSMGYGEVNLNLGCPSGTVVSKGRGSGLLADPETLTVFLDEIFSQSPIPISIKTRIGMERPDEFPALFTLFLQYPVKELIIHPRLRTDYYRNHPNLDAFALALEQDRQPIGYSGDLFNRNDVIHFEAAYPNTHSVMLGRGLIANPGLYRELSTGEAITKQQLLAFHQDLYEQYRAVLFGTKPVLHKMKELWHYMIFLFSAHDKHAKRLRKAQTLSEFEAAVAALFRDLDLCTMPGFRP